MNMMIKRKFFWLAAACVISAGININAVPDRNIKYINILNSSACRIKVYVKQTDHNVLFMGDTAAGKSFSHIVKNPKFFTDYLESIKVEDVRPADAVVILRKDLNLKNDGSVFLELTYRRQLVNKPGVGG